MPLINFFKQES